MRIFYDGYIYTLQSSGGINRYFANLIARLPQDWSPVLTTAQLRSLMFPQHPRLKVRHYPRFGFRPGRLSYLVEQYYFRLVLAQERPDVFHPTYYHLLSRDQFRGVRAPVVVTVYDLLHERYPDDLDPSGTEREQKRIALSRADVIVAISESTRRDVIEHYPETAKRVRVIYPGSSLQRPPQLGGRANLRERPFFLFVGNRWNYKNFPLVLEALEILIDRGADVELVVVGPQWTDLERKKLAEGRVEQRVFLAGHAADAELAEWYAQSLGLVYPSRYEGFGFPPLEAMSCGAPVIATNISSLPEVVGDAGLLIPPGSVAALTEAMTQLLAGTQRGEELREQGYRQASRFSWDLMAEQFKTLYADLCR